MEAKHKRKRRLVQSRQPGKRLKGYWIVILKYSPIWGLIIVIAVAIVLVIRIFFYEIFQALLQVEQ